MPSSFDDYTHRTLYCSNLSYLLSYCKTVTVIVSLLGFVEIAQLLTVKLQFLFREDAIQIIRDHQEKILPARLLLVYSKLKMTQMMMHAS